MPSHGYGQFCPVAKAAEVLTERWTPLVLRELLAGSHRFNELRRGIPLMSPTLLADRLRRLERAGVVRRSRPSGGRHWEYHLTEAGEASRALIDLMGAWGRQWAMGRLSLGELDPGLVMWCLLRRVQEQTGRLPQRRVVVLFDIAGAVQGKRYWWLVLTAPECDLCLSDPGFSVDLTWRSDARTIATVLLGELGLERALRNQAIVLEGPPRLRRSVPEWLGFETRPA
jgi:DNA-binding HxlR family transcriptional regulator